MTPGRARRWALGAALIALLIGVYLFTYSGYAISGDEWELFDATESLARRGDMRLNYMFDRHPPLTLAEATPPPADTEPLQPLLAVPLFWVAQALPAIGQAHTVWLFNVLVTALTAGILYAYGLTLGYRIPVALAVALMFGLGTIAWPYSRTFFREPLFTALALLSALLVLRIRQQVQAGRRPGWLVAAFVVVLAGVLFSKEAAFLILPALAVQALPNRIDRFHLSRRSVLLLVVAALMALVLAWGLLNVDTLLGVSGRYAFTTRLSQVRDNLSRASEGVRGYLFSPARGIWWFSPVLLLGLAAWPQLVRSRRWRELAVPLIMLLTFVVGYAAVRGAEWYGGRGWGARYMVPVTPFLALWLLPAVDTLLVRGTAWWKRGGAALLFALGIGVQLVAAIVPIEAYYARLAAQTPPVVPWLEGAWQLRWSPIIVSAQALGDIKADFAWNYAAGPAWALPVLAAGLALAAAVALAWWLSPRAPRRALGPSLALLAALTGLALFGGLFAIRLDPRYYGDFEPARELLSALDGQVRPDDVIVLNDATYAEFFMNYYKRRSPAVYTLPLSPGERASPEQTPNIVTPVSDERIHLGDVLIVTHLAEQHPRLWLIINNSPFIPWSNRPVEEYLARHYFPITDVAPDDLARGVLFDLTPAPAPAEAKWPDHQIDADFGGELALVGADVVRSQVVRPGEVVPVSLLWRTLAPPGHDYTVGLYLIGPDGAPVAQRDSLPIDHFGLTSTWLPGSLYRDNHGLQLPLDLPPGDYGLWVAVYWWQTPSERLPVTAPGGAVSDHAELGTIVVAR